MAKKKPIEVHQYLTPTAGGEKYFSVGVLNVTEKEGRMIKQFAERLMRVRDKTLADMDSSITIPYERELDTRPLTNSTGEFTSNLRFKRGDGGRDDLYTEPGKPGQYYDSKYGMWRDSEAAGRAGDGPKVKKSDPVAPKVGDRFAGIDFGDDK